MNGIHDLGGMDGFGSIPRKSNEPVFPNKWEGRVFALSLVIPFFASYTDDQFRREVERIPPAQYLCISLYERWFLAIEALLIEGGYLKPGEIDAPPISVKSLPLKEIALSADKVVAIIHEGASTRRNASELPARFGVGQRVRVRNEHPNFHTRTARYVRGREGVIVKKHGIFSFPETNARGLGERPQQIYTVCFRSCELWGEISSEHDKVYFDLWDETLAPVVP